MATFYGAPRADRPREWYRTSSRERQVFSLGPQRVRALAWLSKDLSLLYHRAITFHDEVEVRVLRLKRRQAKSTEREEISS